MPHVAYQSARSPLLPRCRNVIVVLHPVPIGRSWGILEKEEIIACERRMLSYTVIYEIYEIILMRMAGLRSGQGLRAALLLQEIIDQRRLLGCIRIDQRLHRAGIGRDIRLDMFHGESNADFLRRLLIGTITQNGSLGHCDSVCFTWFEAQHTYLKLVGRSCDIPDRGIAVNRNLSLSVRKTLDAAVEHHGNRQGSAHQVTRSVSRVARHQLRPGNRLRRFLLLTTSQQKQESK